jgi:hypothetical protein
LSLDLDPPYDRPSTRIFVFDIGSRNDRGVVVIPSATLTPVGLGNTMFKRLKALFKATFASNELFLPQ